MIALRHLPTLLNVDLDVDVDVDHTNPIKRKFSVETETENTGSSSSLSNSVFCLGYASRPLHPTSLLQLFKGNKSFHQV